MNKKSAQILLFNLKAKNNFGGSLLKKSNPKVKRPISTKQPMHIVLRSSYAKGKHSFLNKSHRLSIEKLIKKQEKAWGIKIYRYKNVGNHLHILLRVGHRRQLSGFLRSLTGLIARKILGAEKGQAKATPFWDARPFSRIVTWGKAYQRLLRYFDKNKLEALGFNLGTFIRHARVATNSS